jgi:D-galactarolactone cycloisomerase
MAPAPKINHVKISAVDTFPLRAELKQPFVSGRGAWYKARTALIVRVRTDDGLEGWGEAYGPIDVNKSIVDKLLAPGVLGCDPFSSGSFWERLYARYRDYDPQGSLIACLGAIDIACWDVMGKAVNRPVYELLGGARRTRVMPYATGLYFKSEDGDHTADAVEEARGYCEQGFRAIKVKVALPPREEASRVAAIRDAVGDGMELMADANHAYDFGNALRLGRELQRLGFLWFEEPVLPDDLGGYHELCRALDMEIAGGENFYGARAFALAIRERALDVVQPDLTAMGGITEARKVIALAEAAGARVIPHIWGTGVGTFAALQLMAAIPDQPMTWRPQPLWMEYEQTDNPFRKHLLHEQLAMVEGWVEVPTGPGLGFTVDETVLERHRAW